MSNQWTGRGNLLATTEVSERLQITLMRTNAEECAEIGSVLAAEANAHPAPVALLNPLKAFSENNDESPIFHYPEADTAHLGAIRTTTTAGGDRS
jgi:uncharacterized protein (UPF0261 family)